MPQRSQRRRPIPRLAALITILALCAGVFYATGALENIAFNAYQNTSPPLAVTSDGVTLALAHSRYLTIEPIILTLTNHARTPIYLPATSDSAPVVHGPNLPVTGEGDPCPAIVTWPLSAQEPGVRQLGAVGAGCDVTPRSTCGGGMAPAPPPPVVLAVAPGATVRIEPYGGKPGAPLWSPGAYRFSLQYGLTPAQAALASSHGLTLTTTPVMLTRAWWSPPVYLRWPVIECPMVE